MVDVRMLPVGEGNGELQDTLDQLAREGARRMIAAALRAEADEYVERFSDELDEDGHRLVVRNGRAQERRVTVGSGTIPVRAPRVNDKRVEEESGERQRFSSRILPAYARRSPKVGEVIPILYLRGLSTGDFRPALEGLLGEDAAGLSATSVSRLCKEWEEHHERFRKRLLSFHRYAYLFMDGIHVQVRLGKDPKVCLLIVIGVREDGVKELLAVEDGYRESTESWAGVFRDLKRRGLNEPKLVVGDGALGAWAALRSEVRQDARGSLARGDPLASQPRLERAARRPQLTDPGRQTPRPRVPHQPQLHHDDLPDRRQAQRRSSHRMTHPD
jgi:putative transposase